MLFYLLAQYGATALIAAAQNGKAAVVALLVDRGANLDLLNDVSEPNKTQKQFISN